MVELNSNEKYLPENFPGCCCGGLIPADRNIMGLGFPVKSGCLFKDLEHLQVPLPDNFYEYDGTKHIPNFNPVRWVVSPCPVKFNLKQLEEIAIPARPLQQLNGRIVLFAN